MAVAGMGAYAADKPLFVPGSTFCFKPHQVVDAAMLNSICAGPLRRALLANETGTGKTATYLLSILNMQQDLLKRWLAAKGGVDFKPFALVVPAATLSQVFQEIETICGSQLKVVVYYSKPAILTDPSDARLRSATLTEEEFAEWCSSVTHRSERRKPENSKRLLLTSYNTATHRLLKVIQVDKDGNLAQELHLIFLLCKIY